VIPIHPVAAVPPAPTFAASPGLVAPPPLALYVHWPWCVRKCPYCDFNSHESGGVIDAETEAAYLAALIADLEAALPQVWNRPVLSVFIGGGTPSLMRAETAEALLAALRMRLPLHPGAEITLEANPRHRRSGEVRRLPRRRRHTPFARRAEFRRRQARGAGPHPRRQPRRDARSRWRSAISNASTST
jgi:hypothetical protein